MIFAAPRRGAAAGTLVGAGVRPAATTRRACTMSLLVAFPWASSTGYWSVAQRNDRKKVTYAVGKHHWKARSSRSRPVPYARAKPRAESVPVFATAAPAALYKTVTPFTGGALAAYALMESARVTAQPPSCHKMAAICWLVRMMTGNSGGIAL